MKKIAPYGKAITGSVVAGLGALGAALSDGTVSPVETVTIASATVVALGAIWTIPNADTRTGAP